MDSVNRIRIGLLLLFCVGKWNFLFGQSCTMVCNGLSNISLDATCQHTVTPLDVMQSPYNPVQCSPTGPQYFEITIMAPSGAVIPTSPMVTASELGLTLNVKVKHTPSGNICWSQIHVEDHLPPVFSCIDVTASCNLSDVSPSNPAIGSPLITDNCDGNATVSWSDSFFDVPCNQLVNGINASAYIARSWFATDDWGNTASCIQTIWFERRSVDDIVFPPNRDGIAAPAIPCTAPNTTPQNTGKPTIDGRELDGFCELSYTFADQTLPMCGASYKVLRTWTALDWCNNQVRTALQIIHVADLQPPVIACPANLTVSTDPTSCTGTVALPVATATENCSGPATIQIQTPFGTALPNGGTWLQVPMGEHVLVYRAVDACNNIGTCSVTLTVTDLVPPNTICAGSINATLNAVGTAIIPATSLNLGSFDNCCPQNTLTFEVRKATVPGAVFGPSVAFDCSETGMIIPVCLRSTDCYGNYNECTTAVQILDNSKPVIACPPALTVECANFAGGNLSVYGMPTASDNCGQVTVEELTPEINISSCGTGTVLRHFKATDQGGKTATCNQLITVVNSNPWNGSTQITWPQHYSTGICAVNPATVVPDSLPAPYDRPVLTNNTFCADVGVLYEDQVFYTAPPTCYTIYRTWKVRDWCQYDINNPTGPGQWSHIQTITVADNQAPVFVNAPANLTVSTGDNCKAQVTLPTPLATDCSPYIQYTISGAFGNSVGPFANIPEGIYPVTFQASDGCGNVRNHHFTVTVTDLKAPTVICHNGLAINLMQTGTVSVPARFLDHDSWDNCTPAGQLMLSFSADPTDTLRVFDCENLGSNVVSLWVKDSHGNQAHCNTYVLIQDNTGVCTPPTAPILGGIQTPLAGKISGVKVSIPGSGAIPSVFTDANGNFIFPSVPVNTSWTIVPEKTDNPLNGVSTLDLLLINKHILGQLPLDSPWKILAADANKSGTITTFDIIELRKLILGIYDSLPAQKSWRFVLDTFTFPNPQNPFATILPETAVLGPLELPGDTVSFRGFKIGDVNNTAIGSNLLASDDRAPEIYLEIPDTVLVAGQSLRLPVRYTGSEDLDGWQFAFAFDPTAIDQVGAKIRLESPLDTENFHFQSGNPGMLRGSWIAESTPLKQGDTAFYLEITAGKSGHLSDFVELAPAKQPVPNEGYGEGRALAMGFRFAEKPGAERGGRLAVFPNPFTEKTALQWTMPRAGTGLLQVMNSAGQRIFAKEMIFSEGIQHVPVYARELPGSGVYFVKIESAGQVWVEKLVAQ